VTGRDRTGKYSHFERNSSAAFILCAIQLLKTGMLWPLSVALEWAPEACTLVKWFRSYFRITEGFAYIYFLSCRRERSYRLVPNFGLEVPKTHTKKCVYSGCEGSEGQVLFSPL
jgi:hypothetical protein